MKKVLVITLFALVACKNGENKYPANDSATSVALTKGSNTDALSAGMSVLMIDYYTLKNSFVKEDTIEIKKNTVKLSNDATLVPVKQIKADATIIENANVSIQSIIAQIQGLNGESKLEDKRKDFQTISEQLYDLLRIIQYDKEVVYHFTCTKAFNDNGANWLDNSNKVSNPYLPNLSPACGDVLDSLDFRKK